MTEETPQIDINDIVFMVNLIDVCTKRGAFEGTELKTVGTLREKLSTFIEQYKQNQKETSSDSD